MSELVFRVVDKNGNWIEDAPYYAPSVLYITPLLKEHWEPTGAWKERMQNLQSEYPGFHFEERGWPGEEGVICDPSVLIADVERVGKFLSEKNEQLPRHYWFFRKGTLHVVRYAIFDGRPVHLHGTWDTCHACAVKFDEGEHERRAYRDLIDGKEFSCFPAVLRVGEGWTNFVERSGDEVIVEVSCQSAHEFYKGMLDYIVKVCRYAIDSKLAIKVYFSA